MLYIIRHGQTAKNKQKVLQGRSDLPLNEEGRQQSLDAGAALREQGIKADRVYSSPLIRAVETAKLACGTDDVMTDERLIEMDYGPYEGMDLTSPAPEVIEFFMDFAGTGFWNTARRSQRAATGQNMSVTARSMQFL